MSDVLAVDEGWFSTENDATCRGWGEFLRASTIRDI
jgi:hypothetical protein